MKRIYLDYAATTPLDPAVRRAMEPYFFKEFGNPSSLHSFGQQAIAAVDAARETVARGIGAEFREIIFTGSATEANNLALRGVLKGLRVSGLGIGNREKKIRPRIVISAIEHESVRETARDLEREGVEVVEVPVTHEGVVNLRALEQALTPQTALVSVMYANNEVGTMQPISEIAKIISNFRNGNFQFPISNFQKKPIYHAPRTTYPLFHTDAAQAFQFFDCDVNRLGIDLMTLSAHKIYGPKGVGVLYVRRHRNKDVLSPVFTGGGQEFGLRSGTHNVAGLAGFAEAFRIASTLREKETRRVSLLRQELWRGILASVPSAVVNGVAFSPFTSGSLLTLPNILSVHFPHVRAEELLIRLDIAGIAISGGPACSSRSSQGSRTLRALGLSEIQARESIRFSLGKFTYPAEVRKTISVLQRLFSKDW